MQQQPLQRTRSISLTSPVRQRQHSVKFASGPHSHAARRAMSDPHPIVAVLRTNTKHMNRPTPLYIRQTSLHARQPRPCSAFYDEIRSDARVSAAEQYAHVYVCAVAHTTGNC
jgi:hypothetical protein